MSDPHNDILTSGTPDPDEQRLLDYLNNKLNASETHATERSITDDPFLSDALDGLNQIPNKAVLQTRLDDMNKKLQNTLQVKSSRIRHRKLASGGWAYLTLLILLVLAVVAYIIIRKTGN